MYLRTTTRQNKDGSIVEYYQLAETRWDPSQRRPTAHIIYNFGRAAYSTEGCHPVHVKPATQSMGRLPPSPREACHVDHRKVATYARRSLPPSEQRDAG